MEPVIRRIRNSMMAAGMPVETSKCECNFGRHEIDFRYLALRATVAAVLDGGRATASELEAPSAATPTSPTSRACPCAPRAS